VVERSDTTGTETKRTIIPEGCQQVLHAGIPSGCGFCAFDNPVVFASLDHRL